MKLLVVLAAFVALCAGNAIPLIPGDNSHYVEGVSRYIWMPDGEGVPHLVDLQAPVYEETQPRADAANQYWLYTRQNPTNPDIIADGDYTALKNSHYSANKPLRVIAHGWNNDGNSELNPTITSAFLAVADVNVIVVDWHVYSHYEYVVATTHVPKVGRQLGHFLVWLISNGGGDWNNVHIVGHSLGAHVAGNAGRAAGSRPARVTGMDPAGPNFGGSSNALNLQSGRYVEAIHTDAGILGMKEPIAHADFYPNGGHNPQPGCWVSTCSHSRSWHLFASSVRTNHFVAKHCDTEDDAHNNKCNGSGTMNMGNDIISKRAMGIYGLTTGSAWPF